MIHFDFILDDDDAVLLFDCISEMIGKYQVYIMKAMVHNEGQEYIDFYNKQIEFLENLKKKMKNTRVKEV